MNIGNPHELTVRELAERIRDLVGSSSELVFVPRPQDDPEIRQPDITLASGVLGWGPSVTIDEGLKRTIDWFREHPEVVEAR